MFCPRCGAQMAQGVRFCTNCGNALNQAPAAPVYQPASQPAPRPAPQPVPQPAYYAPPVMQQPVREPSFADRVRDAVRKFGGSPLFLVVAICYTLVQLYSLLTIGSVGSSLYDTLYPILRELGMSAREIRNMLSGIQDTSGIASLLGMIPGILIMSGLWAIYGSSHSHTKKTGTAGLTMIQVVMILELIGIGIVMAIILLPLLVAIIEAGSHSSDLASAAMTGLMIAFVIVAAITAFVFVYYIKICTTISKVKNTLRTGVANRRVSGFVAVMCFIFGGITVISSFVGLIPLLESRYVSSSMLIRGALGTLSSLLGAAAQILVGVLIFMYKSRMAQLEQGDVPPAPVYAQPQPAYQSAPAPAYQQPVYQPAPQPVYQQPAPAPVVAEPVAKPVIVEAPVVEEIPVIVEAPAAEEIPVVEEAPVVEEIPVIEEAPVVEEIPVAEAAPAVEEVPVVEEAPAAEEAPVEEPEPEKEIENAVEEALS